MGSLHNLRPMAKLRASAYALGIALSASAAHGQESIINLTVATFQPEQQAMSVAMKNWADAVTQRSQGRITFDFFWQGSLLKATEVAPGVKDGRADIGLSGAVYVPAQLPLSTIDTLPFMTSNVAAVSRTILAMYEENGALRGEYERNNFKMLGYAPVSINLFFTKQPLASLEDLKNLRIRTVGLAATALKAVGANPIALPQDQVYESLQRGLLDGTFGAGIDLGLDFNFQTLAPYITDPQYGVWASGVYLMNKGVYDGLDDNAKAIFDDMFKKFPDFYLTALRKAEDSRCEKVRTDTSVKLVIWPETEIQKWKQAVGDSARKQWIETASRHGVDGAAFLKDYERRLRALEATEEWNSPIERCLEK